MNKLLLASIWAPDSFPAEEWKYRNLTRMMMPVIDAFFVAGGVAATIHGVPAIDEFFPRSVIHFFAFTLVFVALLSLVGLIFPRLWRLEIFGRVSLLGLLVAYVTSVFIVIALGNANRGFLLFMVTVALCPVVWRLSILGSEWQTRRIDNKGV